MQFSITALELEAKPYELAYQLSTHEATYGRSRRRGILLKVRGDRTAFERAAALALGSAAPPRRSQRSHRQVVAAADRKRRRLESVQANTARFKVKLAPHDGYIARHALHWGLAWLRRKSTRTEVG